MRRKSHLFVERAARRRRFFRKDEGIRSPLTGGFALKTADVDGLPAGQLRPKSNADGGRPRDGKKERGRKNRRNKMQRGQRMSEGERDGAWRREGRHVRQTVERSASTYDSAGALWTWRDGVGDPGDAGPLAHGGAERYRRPIGETCLRLPGNRRGPARTRLRRFEPPLCTCSIQPMVPRAAWRKLPGDAGRLPSGGTSCGAAVSATGITDRQGRSGALDLARRSASCLRLRIRSIRAEGNRKFYKAKGDEWLYSYGVEANLLGEERTDGRLNEINARVGVVLVAFLAGEWVSPLQRKRPNFILDSDPVTFLGKGGSL